MKGGVTRRATRVRIRTLTPELMRPWTQQPERLQVDQRYRFQTRDNRVPITGTYLGREGRNFIFRVNGHRTIFPISIINPIQHTHRPGLAGMEDAFVLVTNGGRLSRKKKNTRKFNRRY